MSAPIKAALARRTLLAAAGLLIASPALGQAAWPDRPIRIIVPFPPGGLTDVQARLLAEHMSTDLGQPVVIENRPGGGGIVGALAVARATPDGYTLLFNISPHVQTPVVMRQFPYDPVADFAQIGRLSTTPIVFMVGPAVAAEVTTLRGFVEWGRGRRLTLGNIAAGSTGHAFGIMFAQEAGLDITQVAYRGETPALQDLLSSNLHSGFMSMAGSGEQVRAGRLRAIGIAGDSRFAGLPGIPTFAESGFSNRFALENFGGLMAPAQTPPAIVQRLQAAFTKAATSEALRTRLVGIDVVPAYLDGAAFRDLIGRIQQQWTEITQALDLKIDG